MELYPAQPIGIDTYEVESLAGFLCRVAAIHQTSSRRLLNYIDDKFHTLVREYYCRKDGRTINGCGVVAQRMTSAVESLYPERDFSQLSMINLGTAFSNGGQGLLKWNRHWCPSCFADDQTRPEGPYDRLIWQLADLEVCPKHNCPLESSCPSCGKTQHSMPSCTVLDRCHWCEHSLGQSSPDSPKWDSCTVAYQNWLRVELPELLLSRIDTKWTYTGIECGAFLKSVCNVRRITPRELAKLLSGAYERVKYTYDGKCKPTLTNWLLLCAELNISPALTLTDPQSAASQLPLELPQMRKRPRKTQKRERPLAHDGDHISTVVRKELAKEKPDYSSISALAIANNSNSDALYYYARTETKKLAAKLATIRRRESNSMRRLQIKHGVAILASRHQNGLETTQRSFRSAVNTKVEISQHRSNEIFPICVDKFTRKFKV
jgi:hypothetical protein